MFNPTSPATKYSGNNPKLHLNIHPTYSTRTRTQYRHRPFPPPTSGTQRNPIPQLLQPHPLRNMFRRMQRQHILRLKRTRTLLAPIHRHIPPATSLLHELRVCGRHHVLVDRVLALKDLAAYGAGELGGGCPGAGGGGGVRGGGVLG